MLWIQVYISAHSWGTVFYNLRVYAVEKGVSASSGPEFATLQQVLEANPRDVALVSDVDDQLLLKINFKQPVRVGYSSR